MAIYLTYSLAQSNAKGGKIQMNPRIRETMALTFMALVVVAVVVGLILLIFNVSGNQELLDQLLQSTAEGELFGIALTAGGPFGMWVIAFLLFRSAVKGSPMGSIKLFLRFPESGVSPPTRPSEFRNSVCSYVIFSHGEKVTEEITIIQTDQISSDVYVPYIYVKAPKIDDPEFQIKLEHQGEEWLSDSYSPKKGSVDLR